MKAAFGWKAEMRLAMVESSQGVAGRDPMPWGVKAGCCGCTGLGVLTLAVAIKGEPNGVKAVRWDGCDTMLTAVGTGTESLNAMEDWGCRQLDGVKRALLPGGRLRKECTDGVRWRE